jgi:hypothetical protein
MEENQLKNLGEDLKAGKLDSIENEILSELNALMEINKLATYENFDQIFLCLTSISMGSDMGYMDYVGDSKRNWDFYDNGDHNYSTGKVLFAKWRAVKEFKKEPWA